MAVAHPGAGAGARAVITIPNDGQAIQAMAGFVLGFCAERGLGEAMAARLAVVLEELLTNSLKYAFVDGARHDIAIALESDGRAITVTYEDDGQPFDPFAVSAPSFDTPVEEWPIGRLGVHLVRCLTDRFSYARDDRRNRITLVKSIPSAPAA